MQQQTSNLPLQLYKEYSIEETFKDRREEKILYSVIGLLTKPTKVEESSKQAFLGLADQWKAEIRFSS